MALVFLLCVASSAVTRAQQLPEPSTLESRIDGYVAPFVEAGHLAGSLLVAQGETILYERAWGTADRASGESFAVGTPSLIASVSKPITVLLAAQLIDEELLGLRDPVSRWLSDFPRGEEIQVQHLLFHRSGIPHRVTEPAEETLPRTPADMAALAARRPLDFDPGRGNSYSSAGFSVLVRVMEVAAGKRYEQLLRERVLEPLGLDHTFHPGPGSPLEGVAKSYTWASDGSRPAAAAKDYSFLVGAGSLFSTPRDLFKVARAVVGQDVGARAQRMLLRAGKLRWNGITNSYRAFLDYDRASDLTIVMVSNQMSGANDLLRRDLPQLVAGEALARRSVPAPTLRTTTTESLRAYEGVYEVAGSPMDIVARDGALMANDWVLLPTGERTFFSPQDYGVVEIVIEQDRPAAMLWSGQRYPRLGDLGR